MPRYVNASVERRAFLTITDPRTGRTLELGPGEEVELDEEIVDPILALAPVSRSVKRERPVEEKGATPPVPEVAPAAVSPKE